MISVVIPHFNQPVLLARCLASLAGQTAGGHDTQIIVADNGSAVLPEAVVAAHPGVRLVAEPTPGPGPARNAGAAVAQGDILAFIDADCVAAPDWLAVIARRFAAEPAPAIIGGDVRILHDDPDRPTAIAAFEEEFSFRMDLFIRDQGFAGTGNLALRRPVFDTVGGFGGLDLAEDREWGQRARTLGFVTEYEPAMVVFHPPRADFAEFARKWDRHTAHDFDAALQRPLGRLRWALRTLAVAASALAHVPRVLRSDRIPGGLRAKLGAVAILFRIRFYRACIMAPLIFARDAAYLSSRWRKG